MTYMVNDSSDTHHALPVVLPLFTVPGEFTPEFLIVQDHNVPQRPHLFNIQVFKVKEIRDIINLLTIL